MNYLFKDLIQIHHKIFLNTTAAEGLGLKEQKIELMSPTTLINHSMSVRSVKHGLVIDKKADEF